MRFAPYRLHCLFMAADIVSADQTRAARSPDFLRLRPSRDTQWQYGSPLPACLCLKLRKGLIRLIHLRGFAIVQVLRLRLLTTSCLEQVSTVRQARLKLRPRTQE